MMLDMDSTLQLPEPILAEQTLQNAGMSHDRQLLIRVAVHGDITMTKICEELAKAMARIEDGLLGTVHIMPCPMRSTTTVRTGATILSR